MIWTVVRKEFYTNLLTLRFAVGLILCSGLGFMSIHVQTKSYESRLSNYNRSIQEHREQLSNVRVWSELKVGVDRRPSVLSIFCEGFERKMGNMAEITYDQVPAEVTRYGHDNPISGVFASVDLVMIIQIVLSVMALFFVCDTVSGEKEQGTLAQMLSNQVPRHQILLGKYFGTLLTLAVPLLAMFLVAFLRAEFSPSVSLTGKDWAQIGLLVVASLIYVSFFALIGLLISSSTRSAALSLILCMFFWITVVNILPNAGGYLASHIRPSISKAVLREEEQKLRDESGSTIRYAVDAIPFVKGKGYQRIIGASFGDYGMPGYIGIGHRSIMLTLLERVKSTVPIQLHYANRMWQVYQRYEESMKKQALLSRSLKRFSPAFCYENLSTALAGTDLAQEDRFMNQTRRYREELISYMQSKAAFSSLLFFTRMSVDELPEDGEHWPDELTRRIAPRENHPPLDLSDMPGFIVPKDRIVSALNRGKLDLTILLFVNFLVFMMAFANFLRYDAR